MRYLRYVLPIALTALALGLIARTVDLDQVSALLARLPAAFLAAAVLLTFGNVVIVSVRYRMVLNRSSGRRTSLPIIVALNLFTLFVSHILPFGALADGVRMTASWRLLSLPPQIAVSSVVQDRLLALAGLIACGLLVLPIQAALGISPRLIALQALMFGGAIILAFAIERLSRRGRLSANRIVSVAAGFTGQFFALLDRPRACAIQLIIATASTAAFALLLVSLGRGLGVSLPLPIALAAAPLIYLSQVVPFFYVGFGAREVTVVTALAGTGILSEPEALSLSLLIGLCNLIVSMPGAVFGLWLTGFRSSGSNAGPPR